MSVEPALASTTTATATTPARPSRWESSSRLADLAGVPWVLDPADTAPGRWGLTLCRTAGFEPDVRFDSPDLLLHVHLVETGHAVAVLPDLLWTERRPAVQLLPLPGRPRRRLFTGARRGAARHPAVWAFRDALRHGLDETQSGAGAPAVEPGSG